MSLAARCDVAVIGGGVVGAAIARELCRFVVDVALVEAGPDVGAGTTKANTALWHTGFDAKPGTLEARLVARGHRLLAEQGPELGIPLERTGALMVAWTPEQAGALDAVRENAERNGYRHARRIDVGELYAREPHLAPGALGALEIPDEGLLCPFTTPLAFATQAVVNGAALLLDAPVRAVESDAAAGRHLLKTPKGTVEARYVVNAAGLHSDTVDRMFGHDRFTVVPRRGELIVFDKHARRLLRHIVLPVPTDRSKGVLVAPTVFGNVLLGPTAEDVDDRAATATTEGGLAGLLERGRRIMPALLDEEVSATYAGLRAATEHGDYQVAGHPSQGYVCAGGVRSTGLSSALAIAEHVRDLLDEAGLALEPRARFAGVRMPNIGEAGTRPYRDAAAIAADPDNGRIVCHCERVTAGELAAALRAVLPARDVDGLRRRTRAMLGRCQGFYCGARIDQLCREQARRAGERWPGAGTVGVTVEGGDG